MSPFKIMINFSKISGAYKLLNQNTLKYRKQVRINERYFSAHRGTYERKRIFIII